MERPWHSGQGLGSVSHILCCRKLALGVYDNCALFALGLGLLGYGALHILWQRHIFKLYIVDLEPPRVCLFVDDLFDAVGYFVAVGQELVERRLTHNVAHCCLCILRYCVVKVLYLEDGKLGREDAVVDNRVYIYRHVVARNGLLVGHIYGLKAHIYLFVELDDRENKPPTGLHNAGELAKGKPHPALILVYLADRDDDDKEGYGSPYPYKCRHIGDYTLLAYYFAMSYQEYFAGKRITLMGLGLLGRGVGDARFLAPLCKELIVTDLKNEGELKGSLDQLKEFSNITYRLGEHNLADFKDRDLILKAAGVPLDSPYIAEAKKNDIPVRMSADLFMELSGVVTVGVTGTRGKSTVTNLIAHILKTTGKEVLLGGNIRGVSTLSLLPEVTPGAIAVLELDSWQCQGLGEAHISPHIAVFTTFLPDHMNYYKNDMAAYFADKENIFLNQKESDTLVLGEQMALALKEYGHQSKVYANVVVAGAKDLPENTTLRVPGEHNRYNAGLASVAAHALEVEDRVIKTALETFDGVPGRLQLIRELGGIKIYNDTTATVPEATLAALTALDPENKKNIILIMGGADKGLDMEKLLAIIPQHCKKVLLLAGTGTERIKGGLPHSSIYGTIAEAVQDGFSFARPGDVLLLSPAFASFGMFKNEYDRGDQFNDAVAQLS